MVADQHEATLFWNVLQLLGTDINRDAHVFKEMVGKLTALIISSSVEQTVDFSKTEVSISRSCDTSAEEAFYAEGILKIRKGYYFSHGC